MEDWPPSGDDAFDFDTGEHRRSGPPEGRDPYGTGEFGRRRRRYETGEHPEQERSPGESGEAPSGEAPTGDPPSGEHPQYPDEDPFALETSEARRRARERGDPFDTGEYRRHRAGRPRHRDLPANIRRRQIFGITGLAALVLVGAYLLFFSGGGGDGGGEAPPLKRLAGQSIISTVGNGGVDGKLLKKVQKGQVGGVIITTDNPQESDLRKDNAQLQKAAAAGDNPPVLVMADQEGGFVKLLPGPPDLSPDQIGSEGADAATTEGENTGDYLGSLGINVDLAPVIDVAHPQTEDTIVSRTFSDDPATVGELGAAFITGMQGKGVAATAKHFPGLGLATGNTDFEQVSVRGTPEDFQADLAPFQQAIEAGVDLIMVSTADYGDLSGNEPAAFSGKMINGLLRGKLGFQGVVITDDLEAPGASGIATPGTAAIQTLRAGGDLALFAQTPGTATSALRAIVKAVGEGRLDQSVLQDAYDRVLALKEKLSGAGPVTTEPGSTTGQTETTTEETAPIGLQGAG